MQNKGAITVFAILLAIASIYQLSFTYVSSRVKSKAEKYAFTKHYESTLPKDIKGEAKSNMIKSFRDTVSAAYESKVPETALNQYTAVYLDSVATLKSYMTYTFREVQQREVNLGLDLKGGMNVILEVSVADLVRGLSNHSTDPTFVKALQLATERQTNTQDDFITLFYEAFTELDKNASLGSIFVTPKFKGQIEVNTPNDEVIKILREEAKDAIDNSLNVLRSRIDRFGVVQPSIQKLEGTGGRILVELPGIKEPERVRKLLQGTANLEFWETFYYTEVYSFFLEADKKLLELNNAEKGITKDTTTLLPDVAVADTLKTDTTSTESKLLALNDTTKKSGLLDNTLPDTLTNKPKESEHPLFDVLKPAFNNQGQPVKSAAIGYAHHKDTAKVNAILKKKQIKAIFPREMHFAWEVKPFDKNEELYQLVALRAKSDKPVLEGDVITNASEETDNTTGEWQVSMSMDSKGSSRWARITKDNKGRQIAIVLDGVVYSYPVVNNEITGGRSSISGNFSQVEAQDLANILKSGKLPARANIIEEAIVGPSLGKEAVSSGLFSFIIAFILVLIYMVFFYKTAGLVADIALLVNVLLIFGVLASLGAVLTLPGIAGIILTLGMAVDANVIIYERIKEEMFAGKGLKLAISDGYKNAYSAIIDGNVTTLITGFVLYIFGHGPIKGFATTLIIGILTSLFSAIFISRLIFTRYLDRNKEISFFSEFTKSVFRNASYDFIGKRKVAYVISGILILGGLISMFTQGLNFGIDFKGGRTYIVKFDAPVQTSDVAAKLKLTFGEAPEVKTYGESNQVKITTKYLIDSKDENADELVEAKLFDGLKPIIGKEDLKKEEFMKTYRQSSQKVGPTIADDIKVAAIWSIVFALLAIFLYIFARFRNWQFGLGAVAALAHDALIVIGLFSILYSILPFTMEIDQAFIAAILTVIGYSVNDTVIIFDRIREYLKLKKNTDRKATYNAALNSTLGRTLNTAGSTLITLIAIFIFGGDVIRGFVFALLIGITVGTYSSLFVATPIVFDSVSEEKLKAKQTSVATNNTREYKGKKKKQGEETDEEKA